MSTTTNAVEFCRFINELGDDFYFEDFNDDLWSELWGADKDGVSFVKPGKADREFIIENEFGGSIVWQGKGNDPIGDRNTETVFQEWKKRQTTKTIVVNVPNERVEEIMAALKNLNVEVAVHE